MNRAPPPSLDSALAPVLHCPLGLLAAESLHGRWRTDLTMELDFGTTMMGCRNPTPTDVFSRFVGGDFDSRDENDGTRGWTVSVHPTGISPF